MTKPLYQQKCQKGTITTQTTPQKVDYTAVADRLRDGQLENQRYPTDGVYRFYRAHLPTHFNSCTIEGMDMQILLYSDITVVYI